MANARPIRTWLRRPRFDLLETRELLTTSPNNVLGAMGDSLTNALRYNSPSLNWVKQLAQSRAIDFGTGPQAQPYYYDEASIGGNTNADNVAHLQAPALAALVNGGDPVSAAVVEVGAHDFGPIGPTPSYNDDVGNPIANTYFSIYNSQLTETNLAAYTDRTVGYIMDAVSTVQASGVRMVVANIPDFGDVPQLQTLSATSDPAKRQLVTGAVDAANVALRTKIDAAGVPLLDLKSLIDLSLQPLVVGGVSVTPSPAIGGPPAFFMDSQHPGGIANGLLANMVIEALDGSYGYDIAPLSDQEILQNAGITSTAAGPTYYDVTRFVHNIDQVAPTTSSAVTAGPVGANGWYTGPVTITLSASDNLFGSGVARTAYSLDGGTTWMPASSPSWIPGGPYGSTGTLTSTVTLSGDGVYHVLYRSIDGAGNEEGTHALAVMIDSTAPTVVQAAGSTALRVSDGATGEVIVVGVAIDNLSGIDPASATYSVTDSQGRRVASGAVTLQPLGGGVYGYAFRTTLGGGGWADNPAGRHFTIAVTVRDFAGNTSVAATGVTMLQGHGRGAESPGSVASDGEFAPLSVLLSGLTEAWDANGKKPGMA